MTLKSYEKKNGIRKKENSFVEDFKYTEVFYRR